MAPTEILRRARRILRSPRTIVAEILGIALAGVLSTLADQDPGVADRVRFEVEHPRLAPWVRGAGLDHVFTTWWFLGLVALAGASLCLVLVEQWRWLFEEWGAPLAEESFRAAPYRVEFERESRRAPPLRIWTRGRVGLLGSPLFHLGLLVVTLAGLGRALFGANAQVDLYEGETLQPAQAAFGAQWPGPLARPLALDWPIVFQRLVPDYYPSGRLRQLTAQVAVQSEGGRRLAEVAINSPLAVGASRLHVSQRHGVAAFVEVSDGDSNERRVLLLGRTGATEFGGSEVYRGGLALRVRVQLTPDFDIPPAASLQARRGGAVASGDLRPLESLPLPGGGRALLRDLRWWVRFDASRDLSAWPAYLGFVLAGAGAILIFAVARVDTLVRATPRGDRERVLVALRAQRFAPLFAERFESLVREEGGPRPS